VPEFLYPAYAVYADGADATTVRPALAGLRHVARLDSPPAAIKRVKPGAAGAKRDQRRHRVTD
jgi:hypothetical protein